MATEAVVASWHERQADRWRRELEELNATGWIYKVTSRGGGAALVVHYPLDDAETIRLRVEFAQTYPYWSPTVSDIDGKLEGSRHRNGATGEICLIHDEHWHADMTVAQLLASQMPKVAAANLGQSALDIPLGLELPAPEPVSVNIGSRERAVIVNDSQTPPPGVEQGALVASFAVTNRIGAGVVENVLGVGFDLETDLPQRALLNFRCTVAGRWIRAEYRPGESATSLWRRIRDRLDPIEVQAIGIGVTEVDQVELIGVLVPDEVRYRDRGGESWLWLLRTRSRPRADGRSTWDVQYRPTQYYSRDLLAERTPFVRELAGQSVVVVGLGSLGMPVAQDLAMTGVGRIVCIDRDIVDLATSTRQSTGGGLVGAGVKKAVLAEVMLGNSAPYAEVVGIHGDLSGMWEHDRNAESREVSAEVRKALATADLTIDCTGNPAATRFLAAYRAMVGKPHLVASGTAGGWGGVVTLLDPEPGSGCWSCVEHSRADSLLPVPPADEIDGMVVPTRCAEPTFRGARHAMQQIAMHASAVAVNYLAGSPLSGNYWVASMRDDRGQPIPIEWTTSSVAPHQACPLHARARAHCEEGEACFEGNDVAGQRRRSSTIVSIQHTATRDRSESDSTP